MGLDEKKRLDRELAATPRRKNKRLQEEEHVIVGSEPPRESDRPQTSLQGLRIRRYKEPNDYFNGDPS